MISKSGVPISIHIGEDNRILSCDTFVPNPSEASPPIPPPIVSKQAITTATKKSNKLVEVPLITLCYGRSGDKGDASNIGLIARYLYLFVNNSRKPEYFSIIEEQVTAEAVYSYMQHLVKGKVTRYELPGIHGFNFVLTKSLGG